MKYLFITLKVQDGENQHTHRVLTTTKSKDISRAAQLYAKSYYGKGEQDEFSNWFNFNCGTIAVMVENVQELTESEYQLLSDIFSGNVREPKILHPSDEEILGFKRKWEQSHLEITANLGYPKSHSDSDDLLMVDFFWVEKDKRWYPKSASLYTPREQLIADYIRYK